MHEIVSLQFGQRANYESYFTYSDQDRPAIDHDVHFRGGIGIDGSETFTPRTVIYDLKGGFGTLRKYNALYELFGEDTLVNNPWQGNASTHKQPVIEPNEYQKNLDQGLPTSQLAADQIRYWSDFNRVFYHPRSIVQLNEFELHSQSIPFENWDAGQDLFVDLDKEFDLFDRDVRPFAEECDQLAGIQIFTSTDDAWGGFTARYADVLRDELGKTSLWLWGVEDSMRVDRVSCIIMEMLRRIMVDTEQQTEIRRTANAARCLQAMALQASAYIRLSSPPSGVSGYIGLDQSSEWSKSSLLCMAVETVTLPSRLREGNGRLGSLAELETSVNKTASRTIFELRASVATMNGRTSSRQARVEKPVLNQSQESLLSPGHLMTFDLDYSPGGSRPTLGHHPHFFNQAEIRRTSSLPSQQLPFISGGLSEDQDAIVDIYPASIPFPQLDTIPHTLFGPSRQAVDIRASLATSSETSARLKKMARLISRVIEVEHREALLNDLAELGEAYETD